MREEVRDRVIDRQKAKIPFIIAADPRVYSNPARAFVKKSEEGRRELGKTWILVKNLTEHFDIAKSLECQKYTFFSVLDRSPFR